jgi:hypothetical protein
MGTKPPSGPQPISTTRAGAAGSEARTNSHTAASQRSSGVTGQSLRCCPGLADATGGWPGPAPTRIVAKADVADQDVADQLVAD